MADNENRTFETDETRANRATNQGLGVGQREMDAQRDPSREYSATRPESPSWRGDMEGPTGADRPSEADFGEDRAANDDRGDGPSLATGDLGEGTPPNVDLTKIGQSDNPQEDWGEPADMGTMHSSNHTRRAEKTEAERGQGAKTRAFNKDMMSRRT